MFIKFPSIENHYQERWIDQFLTKYGNELECSLFILQEKLHGCLHKDTLISTKEFGDVSIEFLVNNKIKAHVYSFNHDTNEIEWDEIIDFSCIDDFDKQWYNVELEDGTILTITGNHKVWVEEKQKYISIDQLNYQDNIYLMKK